MLDRADRVGRDQDVLRTRLCRNGPEAERRRGQRCSRTALELEGDLAAWVSCVSGERKEAGAEANDY